MIMWLCTCIVGCLPYHPGQFEPMPPLAPCHPPVNGTSCWYCFFLLPFCGMRCGALFMRRRSAQPARLPMPLRVAALAP